MILSWTSLLWVPIVAFGLRELFTPFNGWVWFLFVILWPIPFLVLNLIGLVSMQVVRKRTAGGVGRSLKTRAAVWWTLIAVPVIVAPEILDGPLHYNPVMRWFLEPFVELRNEVPGMKVTYVLTALALVAWIAWMGPMIAYLWRTRSSVREASAPEETTDELH